MILGLDVGNTHIAPIIYNENGEIQAIFRIPTQTIMTEDTLFITLKSLCETIHFDITKIENIIISSVVPHLHGIFMYFTKKYFQKEPFFVSLKPVEDQIIIPADGHKQLGADRIIDILACQKYYPNEPCIVIDFGTATTFDVIENNHYIGGAILPGIDISIDTLFRNAAQLPKISFEKVTNPLGLNTIDQIKIGIYYGNIGAIRELIDVYKNILPHAHVITTGGQGETISEMIPTIDQYVKHLTYEGLFIFYDILKNKSIK